MALLSDHVSTFAGTIDTNGFNGTINGDVTGDGTLLKRGAGTLRLAGNVTQPTGTVVTEGTLAVTGHHVGRVLLDGSSSSSGTSATLAGTGRST